jgi:glycosyltransferase involved in cell wall biosynthesis
VLLTHPMNRLSACLITLNEEHNLPRALASLEGLADEIIVVDSGSTDRTPIIAQEHGAVVF